MASVNHIIHNDDMAAIDRAGQLSDMFALVLGMVFLEKVE
jgi:hypothetical protein